MRGEGALQKGRGGRQSPEPAHLLQLPSLEIGRAHFGDTATDLPCKKGKVQMQEALVVWDRISLCMKLEEKDAVCAVINF